MLIVTVEMPGPSLGDPRWPPLARTEWQVWIKLEQQQKGGRQVCRRLGQSESHLGPPSHPTFRDLGPLPPASVGLGGWETGCRWLEHLDQVPRSCHLQDLRSPGARKVASPGFEAQMVGRPRSQAAQRSPHYCSGCRHHCTCWGPRGPGCGSGVRGFGWCLGVHERWAAGQGLGSGPGPDCGYDAAWTCQGWGCGTWVRAAPGCCHPRPPSWHLYCLCCYWPTPR